MAGLKQHYIPQFLLRGFSRSGKSKNAMVAVYPKDSPRYISATQGVGSQRAFYSNPNQEFSITSLDDRITSHEKSIVDFIQRCRSVDFGFEINTVEAAEVATHLLFRVAHIREIFTSAVSSMFDVLRPAFEDPDEFGRYLKLDDPTPSKIVRDIIRQAWQENRQQAQARGITREAWERAALQQSRQSLGTSMAGLAPQMQLLFEQLRGRSAEAARVGHLKGLETTLAPEPKVKVLSKLQWSIECNPDGACILPDCVGAALSGEQQCIPLVLADENEIDTVVLPISSVQLLVGHRSREAPLSLSNINRKLAATSWDFFIAGDDQEEHPEYHSLIRSTISEYVQKLVEQSTSKGIIR